MRHGSSAPATATAESVAISGISTRAEAKVGVTVEIAAMRGALALPIFFA